MAYLLIREMKMIWCEVGTAKTIPTLCNGEMDFERLGFEST